MLVLIGKQNSLFQREGLMQKHHNVLPHPDQVYIYY